MSKKKPETVGYGKPPVHSRWPKGKSGNPSGRPAKRQSRLCDVIESGLAQKIKITEGKTVKRKTAFEIILLHLWLKATQGNARALRAFFAYEEFARRKPEFRILRVTGNEAEAYARSLTQDRKLPKPWDREMTAREAAALYAKTLAEMKGEI